MATLIEAQGLTKRYGKTIALDGASFRVETGRIVGLIGPNGAGKTTALKAVLGLARCEGSLTVLGLDPYRERDRLMEQVSFIADVAVLPRWLRVQQAVDFVAGVHPRFRPERCQAFLERTSIRRSSRIRELSKGMITQLHLALVMAIDARLLVLDEPTLGLDILSRKQFYDNLLSDYMDAEKTILVTTHQVEEIENILTDLLFIDRGRIVLDLPMDEIPAHYAQLLAAPAQAEAARALRPFSERQLLGRHVFLYENADHAALATFGSPCRRNPTRLPITRNGQVLGYFAACADFHCTDSGVNCRISMRSPSGSRALVSGAPVRSTCTGWSNLTPRPASSATVALMSAASRPKCVNPGGRSGRAGMISKLVPGLISR